MYNMYVYLQLCPSEISEGFHSPSKNSKESTQQVSIILLLLSVAVMCYSEATATAVPEKNWLWVAVNAEIKVPSVENPEVWNRSKYSSACFFANCQEFRLSKFCLPGTFNFFFKPSLSCHVMMVNQIFICHIIYDNLFWPSWLTGHCISIYNKATENE